MKKIYINDFEDLKHVLWLLRNSFKQFILGNFKASHLSFMWAKLHITTKHIRVKAGGKV